MSQPAERNDQLRFLLSKGRIRDALALLNSLSPYRFTALFRFGDAGLHNLTLYDRRSGHAPRLASIPIGDAYCTYVRDLRDAFVVEDSLGDARVDGHPKRPEVCAYCGVPLRNARGELFGTVCHFDFDAVAASDDARALLAEVAAYLDPQQAEDTITGELTERIDALASMLALLLEVSSSQREAIDAFEEYARPIRDGVSQLGPARHAQLHARVDALPHELTARAHAHLPAG